MRLLNIFYEPGVVLTSFIPKTSTERHHVVRTQGSAGTEDNPIDNDPGVTRLSLGSLKQPFGEREPGNPLLRSEARGSDLLYKVGSPPGYRFTQASDGPSLCRHGLRGPGGQRPLGPQSPF